jgi:hypothetical protein
MTGFSKRLPAVQESTFRTPAWIFYLFEGMGTFSHRSELLARVLGWKSTLSSVAPIGGSPAAQPALGRPADSGTL